MMVLATFYDECSLANIRYLVLDSGTWPGTSSTKSAAQKTLRRHPYRPRSIQPPTTNHPSLTSYLESFATHPSKKTSIVEPGRRLVDKGKSSPSPRFQAMTRIGGPLSSPQQEGIRAKVPLGLLLQLWSCG